MADKKIKSNLIIDGTISHQDGGAANEVFTTNGSRTTLPSGGVVFVANEASLPGTGVVDTLYIAKAENSLWEWNGSTYDPLGSSSAGQLNINNFIEIYEADLSSKDEAGIAQYLNSKSPVIDNTDGKNLYLKVIPGSDVTTEFTIDTSLSTNPTLFTIPIDTTTHIVSVDWGDGITNTTKAHTYASSGIYTIKLTVLKAQTTKWARTFGDVNDMPKITSLKYWGGVVYDNFAFDGCSNLNLLEAQGKPTLNFSSSGLFLNCTSLTYINDLHLWETSGNMSRCFEGCTNFNQPLTGFIQAGVESAAQLLWQCSSFNSDVSGWNFSTVTSLHACFRATPFNHPSILTWDFSTGISTFSMSSMFSENYAFNQAIGIWDVSRVSDMNSMFMNSNFNQSLANWDTSNCTNFTSMLNATPFNNDVSGWVISDNASLSSVFANSSFNHSSIQNWSIGNNINMYRTFYQNYAFDQDLSLWNMAGVDPLSGSSFNTFISNTSYSHLTACYTNWSAQNLPNGWEVTFNCYYNSSAQTARNSIAAKWTLTDLGTI